jgi:hypothetical protein
LEQEEQQEPAECSGPSSKEHLQFFQQLHQQVVVEVELIMFSWNVVRRIWRWWIRWRSYAFAVGAAGNTPPVSPPQGNGGAPGNSSPTYGGGGGGGASAVGSSSGPGTGGAGGAGSANSISGFTSNLCRRRWSRRINSTGTQMVQVVLVEEEMVEVFRNSIIQVEVVVEEHLEDQEELEDRVLL